MAKFKGMHGAAIVAVMVAGINAVPAQAQTARAARDIDLPAGPLGNAIAQLGRKTGVMIVFNPALVRGKRSADLHGNYSVEQALTMLLASSGLRMVDDGRGGYRIERGIPDPTARRENRPQRRPSPRSSTAAAPAPQTLEPSAEIVVTAARTILPVTALPLTADVIEREALARQVAIAGSTVDAISALSPSFSPTRQKLTGIGETLRGRSPLYAINGIPQSTPIRDGSRDGYTIDPFFIDRIELIYGSNALQGIGATGGVVNQVTVGPPEHDGVNGRLLVQGTGDDGFADDSLGGKVAGLVGYRSGIFDATVGAAYEKRGAFRDAEGRRIGIDTAQGEVQDSRSWSFFGRFGVRLGDTARLDLVANRFELNGDGDYTPVAGNRATGLPTGSRRAKVEGEAPANRYELVSLSLTDTDLAGGNLVTQLFYNRSNDLFGGDRSSTFQDVRIAPNGTLFDQTVNRSRKLGARASYERGVPGIPGLTGTIGIDALLDRTEQALVQTDRVWVPPTDFRSIAPFAQANLALFQGALRFAGGVRYENVRLKVDDFVTLASYGSRSVVGGAPSFRDALVNGGVVVEPLTGIRLYGSYAEGFTIPDVGRILRAIRINGVRVDDYLDLQPIVSNNRELGAEIRRGPLDASVSYFWSASNRGQVLVPVSGVQLYEAERRRVEVSGLELNMKVRTPLPGLAVNLGYAHLTGRSDSNLDGTVDDDLDGANISPDRLNLAADYRRGRLSARVQGQFYLSRRFQGGDPRNDFAGYALADGFVRYETDLGGVSLSVQNLFDTQYITYNSDTGYPTDNLRFFSGRGRTLTLGWDWRF